MPFLNEMLCPCPEEMVRTFGEVNGICQSMLCVFCSLCEDDIFSSAFIHFKCCKRYKKLRTLFLLNWDNILILGVLTT
jgi:hypothetical protein